MLYYVRKRWMVLCELHFVTPGNIPGLELEGYTESIIPVCFRFVSAENGSYFCLCLLTARWRLTTTWHKSRPDRQGDGGYLIDTAEQSRRQTRFINQDSHQQNASLLDSERRNYSVQQVCMNINLDIYTIPYQESSSLMRFCFGFGLHFDF